MAVHNHYHVTTRRGYGLGSFLFDAFMTVITSGLWLLWVFVREVRGLR